jgi:HJR/Mrr/RecB family endonuclease
MKTAFFIFSLISFASPFAYADVCSFNASPQDPVLTYSCNGNKTKEMNAADLKVDSSDSLQIESAALKHFSDLGYSVVSCSQIGDQQARALNCLVKK